MKVTASDLSANNLSAKIPSVVNFKVGTNFDAAKDMHMHEAMIELVGDDHIKSQWTMFNNGKPTQTAKFDLKRKK